MNSQLESPKSKLEPIRGNKKPSAILGIVAVGLLAACTGPKQTQPVDAAGTVCVVSTETQMYQFQDGQGIQNAVHAIKGSGSGEGDECWDEATAAVEGALHGNQPGHDTEVRIPVSVEPKQ